MVIEEDSPGRILIKESSLKWRWEFMRRDPAVRKIYQHCLNMPINQKILDICEDLEVRYLPLPDITKTFDELIDSGTPKDTLIAQFSGHPLEKISVEWDRSKSQEEVYIRVDCRFAYLTKKLFCSLIDEIRMNKRANSELKIIVHIRRIQERQIYRQRKDYAAERYRLILKAGELRNGHYPKLTYLQIAEKINERGQSEEDTKRKIGRWCKAYDELIHGGWRDIV
jgi:hypothetical protein